MTIKEKIKKAWAMQYSATIEVYNKKADKDLRYQIVGVNKAKFFCIDSEMKEPFYMNIYDHIKVKITGYKYAGELAGSEPIPEGQKFRVKKTGEFLKHVNGKAIVDAYDKSEIEPVFNS